MKTSLLTVFFSLGLLLLCSLRSEAQAPTDSLPSSGSPVMKSEEDSIGHSVRKATLLSTFLPGAGQIYNRRYWKVPILYAGFAGMAYLIKFNNTNYKKYNNALISRQDDNPNTNDLEYVGKYSDENLRTLSNYYHRNRDLSIAVTVLIYALNIIDAHVDAHLYTFDVSDDLSLRVQPTLLPKSYMGFNGYTPGLGASLRF